MEAAWITLRDTVYSTATESLGPSTRRHRDWFDENYAEIMNLIGKKCSAHLVHLHDLQCITNKDALKSICSTVQLKLREMQDSNLSARADDIQGYANKNDLKDFYSSLKEVYSLTSAGSSSVLRADETKLILEKTRSWRGGLIFSMVYERGHISTSRPLNDCLKSQ